MAEIVISNIDEQVKQNFERFCANADMNMAAAFSALLKVGMNMNEQGLLGNATDELRRHQKSAALKNIFAEAEKSETNLTDEEWEELANIRSQSDFNREVEKWFTL